MSPPDVVSNGVSFEVERFEWVDGDRLEVTGRWDGLRGHRFVRPGLVVQAGAEQRRERVVPGRCSGRGGNRFVGPVLVGQAGGGRRRRRGMLEHKPWAADDGEEWT